MVFSAELSATVLSVDVCRCVLRLLQQEGERILGYVSGGGDKGWCTFIGRRDLGHRQKVC